MPLPELPPLNALRFFEAAARHGSFAAAARELRVTPACISYRIKSLERHLGTELFARFAHGVRLNPQSQAYLKDIQRIFADLDQATRRRRHRRQTPLLKLVTIEVVAEKWLMPQLAGFTAVHPEITIEFDVDHGEVDPDRRDFDVWIAFTDQVPDTLHSERLLEETVPRLQPGPSGGPGTAPRGGRREVADAPACGLHRRSPGDHHRVRRRPRRSRSGSPRKPKDLHGWPLVYDLHWTTDWSHWFTHHGVASADLSQAFGFRLYTMVVQAAVDGIGVALGHSLMIARELEQGTLVTLFDSPVAARAPYLLVTAPASRRKPEVVAFRDWILAQASLNC